MFLGTRLCLSGVANTHLFASESIHSIDWEDGTNRGMTMECSESDAQKAIKYRIEDRVFGSIVMFTFIDPLLLDNFVVLVCE